MLDLKVIQRGRKQAITKLTGLGKDIAKPKALYARWAVQALRWIDQNFKTEGGMLSGRKWKKMSARTFAHRRRGRRSKKKTAKLLQDTGRLRSSFVYRMLSGNRGVAVGTNVHYAATHEFGDAKRNIPQRRMLPKAKDKTFVEKIEKTTNNYMTELIKKSGGA